MRECDCLCTPSLRMGKEEVLKLDNGDSGTVNVLNVTKLYTMKWLQW